LIGTKKDEDILVKVTFPENYGSKDLAGQDVEFDVKVHEVLEAQEVEIDDEFAKSLGLESLEKLREAIKGQIENDFVMICRTKLKKDIFDYLDSNCKFEVPESMIQLEYNSIIESAKKDQKTEGQKEEVTKEQEAEFKVLAERRVRLGVILAEMGRENSLEVTANELQSAVFETARRYPGQEKQIFEYYSKNKQALDQLKGPILEEKVVDYIVENSGLKESKKTTDELLKIQEEMSE
jgi:trigger factor